MLLTFIFCKRKVLGWNWSPQANWSRPSNLGVESRGGQREALPFKKHKTLNYAPAALSPILGSSRQNISQLTCDNPHGRAGILFKAPPSPSGRLANRWRRVDPACLDPADPTQSHPQPLPPCRPCHQRGGRVVRLSLITFGGVKMTGSKSTDSKLNIMHGKRIPNHNIQLRYIFSHMIFLCMYF